MKTMSVGQFLFQGYILPLKIKVEDLAKELGIKEDRLWKILFEASTVSIEECELLANYFNTSKESLRQRQINFTSENESFLKDFLSETDGIEVTFDKETGMFRGEVKGVAGYIDFYSEDASGIVDSLSESVKLYKYTCLENNLKVFKD